MSESKIEYYPDPIAAFNDGCLMDLRFRTALQFMTAMLNTGLAQDADPEKVAAHALNIVDELFAQGKKRGWISPLPESSEINASMKAHLSRAVKAQVHQQKIAQQEQAGSVRPIMNG